MRHRFQRITPLLGLCLALVLAACPWSPRLDDSFYLGGIQVGEPNLERWIEGLRAAGMNTASVTVYARQGVWSSADLRHEPLSAEANQKVLREIREVKEAGLKVALILRVHLEPAPIENRHIWHGMIMPGSEEELAAWFERYAAFVLQWAEVAAKEGVDLLGIGSELNALASTQPINEMPGLEEYYLDPEKQEEYKREVLAGVAAGASLDDASAGSSGGAGREIGAVEELLADKVNTYQAWAEQMTAQGEAGALRMINHRRALLETHWRGVIEAARRVYRGSLTYAANFDQYHQVGFWPQLDVMGINAYFPLRKRFLSEEERGELPSLLRQGWRGVLAEVDAFRRAEEVSDMPVVFTELGYTERLDCTLAPWAGDSFTMVWGEGKPGPDGQTEAEKRIIVWDRQPMDPSERLAAVAALREVSQGEFPGLLRGILYWKISTLAQHRAEEPFLAVLGRDRASRPLFAELQRFRHLP